MGTCQDTHPAPRRLARQGHQCQISVSLRAAAGILGGAASIASAGPIGTASLVIPWPTNPAYNGVNFGFQVLSFDPGAPLGYTLSNALDVFLSF